MLCLAIALCFASRSWRIALELLHHGCDFNVRICTKHGVFSGKRRSRCGEKYARARDGLRHRRFSVESFSVLAVRLSRCPVPVVPLSRSRCPVSRSRCPFPVSCWRAAAVRKSLFSATISAASMWNFSDLFA